MTERTPEQLARACADAMFSRDQATQRLGIALLDAPEGNGHREVAGRRLDLEGPLPLERAGCVGLPGRHGGCQHHRHQQP